MKIIEYFLRKHLAANLIMVLVIVLGTIVLFQVKRATYPAVDFDILKITTIYPGASSHDVEINVTKKLEDEIKVIDGIDRIRSFSVENLSLIYVFIDTDSDDIKQAKDDVRRGIDRVVDFPEAVSDKPAVEELRSANVPVIEVAVIGDVPELISRKVAQDLEDEILEIPGVMSVEKVGYRRREIKILVDADKLSEKYLSFDEVVSSIHDRNVRSTGGNLESYRTEKKIVTFSEFQDPMQVGKVIVRSNFEDQKIPLNDIASIQNSFEDYRVKPHTDGKLSINLLVRSHGKGDAIDISNDIKKLIKVHQAFLPQGLSIKIVSDFSRYTKNVLGIVKSNAIIGFLLVILTLVLFLDRYSALWVAAGIPLSLLGAIIFFPLFGIDINFVSLVSMIVVLGLVVDDTIVIGENICHYRQIGLSAHEAALRGVRDVFWPVTTTVITTILVFIPMFFMVGITGKFIRQVPIIVILALSISLLEAVIFLPTHLAHSPYRQPHSRFIMTRLQQCYKKILYKVLRHRIRVLIILALVPLSAAFLYGYGMKFILFPHTDIDIFYVIGEIEEGSNIESTTIKFKEVEDIVSRIPQREVQSFTTRFGHHDWENYGVSAGLHENWAMIAVYLKPAAERGRTSEIIMADIDKQLKQLAGFKKLSIEKYYDGPPMGKPVTVTYVSDDHEVLEKIANKTYVFLETIKGIRSLDNDLKPGTKELRLELDYEAMARTGVSVRQVSETLRTAYDGTVASTLTQEGEEIDFRVQLLPEQRKHVDTLTSLRILNNRGQLIRLGSFTRFGPAQGYESINHYNGRRAITITADVDTEIITSIEANQLIRDEFEDKVRAIPGLRMVFGGEEKATKESLRSLYWAFLCAVIAIYFLLIIVLESFVYPLLIMGAIPFGLAGVAFGFYIHGLPLCFFALIGCLGLVGVIINDALIMITHLNTLRRNKGSISQDELVSGCCHRLRPVILTTVTTVAGVIPTIYGFGGYEPFIVPVVLAIGTGLIVATLGTLYLIPIMYSFHR